MIARQAAWVAVGQAAVIAAGLASTRIVTSLLPPDAYGEVSLVVGLGALGMGLLCTPVLQAALRFFPEARDSGSIGALRGLTSHYLRGGVLIIALFLAIAGATWTYFGGSALPYVIFLAAGALVGSEAWRNFESGFLNGARRQREFAIRAIADALARPAAVTMLLLLVARNSLAVIAGFAIGSAIVSVLLRRQSVSGETREPWGKDPWVLAHRGRFLAYAMPLAPLAAMNWIMSMGGRYVLAAHWGTGAVGIYWAAYAIGSQPFIAANAIVHSTLRPALYDAVAAGDAAREQRIMRAWLLLVTGFAVSGWGLVWLFAEPVCSILLGSAFGEAAGLLPWIAAAHALQMVQQAFEITLYAHGQSTRLVSLQAVAAVAAALFYILLIPELGGTGAALGALGSMFLTTLLALYLARGWRWIGLPALNRNTNRPDA